MTFLKLLQDFPFISSSTHHDLHVAGSWLGAGAASPLLPLGDGGAPLVVDVEDLPPLRLGDASLQRGSVAIWTMTLKHNISSFDIHLDFCNYHGFQMIDVASEKI